MKDIKNISIWDLDGTVIDSSHRYRSKSNGDIDLQFWLDSNTPENCKKDKLLPAIRTIRSDYADGNYIIICTARVLNTWDIQFLRDNNIRYHTILARPENCSQPDAMIKEFHLRDHCAHVLKMSWTRFCMTSLFYEDSQSVIARMSEIGVKTIDSNNWNELISANEF